MLEITYGPVDSVLHSSDKRELKEAFKILGKEYNIWVDGANFSPRYQRGVWDGRKAFFSQTSGKFKSGLLGIVIKTLSQEEFALEIHGYPDPFPGYSEVTRIELAGKDGPLVIDKDDPIRGYQVEGLQQILKYHRGILKMATNAGKTEVAASILKALNIPPTIFIVPFRELLHQTKERLEERLGVPVGIVGDSIWKPNENGITVAMYQTLSSHFDGPAKKWYSKIKVVFCDECHLVMADTYGKCLRRINAEYRVGLSATPFEQGLINRLTVTGLLGPVLSAVNNAKLMDKGVSVRPSVLVLEPQVPAKEALVLKMQDYDEALLQCGNRNRLIGAVTNGLLASQRQTLVMVNRVSHAHILARLIPGAMVVTSNTGNRKEAVQRLTKGEVFCCITTLFDTGLSVDFIEGMVLAGGGKSAVKLLQKIGRTVRQASDRVKSLWIVDFTDSYNMYTKRHSKERMQIFKDQNAFVITEQLSDAPAELQSFITPDLINSKHMQKSLGLS